MKTITTADTTSDYLNFYYLNQPIRTFNKCIEWNYEFYRHKLCMRPRCATYAQSLLF